MGLETKYGTAHCTDVFFFNRYVVFLYKSLPDSLVSISFPKILRKQKKKKKSIISFKWLLLAELDAQTGTKNKYSISIV